MINIFVSSLIGSIIIIANGYIFHYLILKKKLNEFNIYIDGLLGFVFIGFLGLLINFFSPVTKNISTIFLIISIYVFIYFLLKKKKINILWILIYLTVTTFIIITFSNINRPDRALSFNFVKILNENK